MRRIAAEFSSPAKISASLSGERPIIDPLSNRKRWTKFFNPRLHESSLRRPDNVAATVGQALGATGTYAPALSSCLTYISSGALREAHQRALLGTTMLGMTSALAPAGPAPL